MKKLKVCTVVGTRPEIIRLSRTIAALDLTCEHVLVHTGQNYDYELNQIFFDDLGIRKPDHFLDAAVPGAAQTIANIIAKVDEVLAKIKPDALLVLGDTNSCMAVLPAKRRKIPVFHMEAGNRCFDQRVPEEINRKIVDHTSDINLTYSSIAREYLLREGVPSDQVIKTGSPMFEVLHHYRDKIEASDVLSRLGLDEHKYFLVSCHREENVDSEKNLQKVATILNSLVATHKISVIVSTHPRTLKKITEFGIKLSPEVQLLKPLGFSDYNRLQQKSFVTISDSGTITEESSILDFPAINLREAHERPEGMEEASVMMTGLELERVEQAIEVLRLERSHKVVRRPVADYSMPDVSHKVVRIIHSYTDYVNRVVWKKY
ncbi:MAG: non-hydrolyzing UDP-N-acetylglucosamine 2-epimerase [Bacteriovoracia bacterium]